MSAIEAPGWLPRGGTESGMRRPPFAVQSRARGVALAVALPRPVLAALLPPGLTLAAAPGADAATHPLVVVAAQHRECTGLAGAHRIGRAADFDELLLAVPLVTGPGTTVPRLFVPRMYSSSPLTVWNGNQFYGFAKQPGRLRWQRQLCVLSDGADRLVATIGAAPQATTVQPAPAAVELPLLGRTASGRLVRSHLTWDDGPLIPADAWLRLAAGNGLLPAGEWQAAAGEAWLFEGMRWRLSWPQ